MNIQKGLTPFWTILAALLLVSNAQAAKLAYTCVIKDIYNLDDQGHLRSSGLEKYFSLENPGYFQLGQDVGDPQHQQQKSGVNQIAQFGGHGVFHTAHSPGEWMRIVPVLSSSAGRER
jgi:hypothetical protein